MATNAPVNTSEFTTCSICFETFKCPKSLPCLHSFCKACITSYFTSALGQGHGNKKSIECPICRTEVEKPAQEGTAEQWADQLPTNHLLVSMMDIAIASERKQVCASCELESKTESATSWCTKCKKAMCEKCERKHALFTSSAEHRVVNINDINNVDPQLFGCDIPCPRHPEKKIEAYCYDHGTSCCVSCVMINHRKCDKVENADTAANEFRKSNVYKEMKKDFEALKLRMNELAEANKENVENFQRKSTEIKTKIKSLRRQMNEHLDILERNILDELSALEKEHIPNIESNIQDINGEDKRVQNALDILSACTEFASNEQLLVETEKLRAQKEDITAILKKNEKSMKRIKIHFKENEELARITEKVKELGKIKVTEKELLQSDGVTDYLSAEPKHLASVNIKANPPAITGCCLVDNTRLIVANFTHQSIALYRMDGTLLSSLTLGGHVWGVDMINDCLGAATLYTRNQIAFFDITDDELSLTQSVALSGYLYGIVHVDNKLYVGSDNKIIILDTQGKILGEIPLSDVGEIRHLAFSDDKTLYCTNYSKVFSISLDGKSLFTYSSAELQNPEGIGTDPDGNVYVIGQSSRDVHQLTSDGQFCRISLKNLPSGQINSFHFCKPLNRLVFNTGSTVHVYEMKNKE